MSRLFSSMTQENYSNQQGQLAGSTRIPRAKPYMDKARIPIPI